MAKKYYAYLILRTGEKGIGENWKSVEPKVKGKEARYRGFKTRKEAEVWLKAGADYALKHVKKLKKGIYFDAGTGRGHGVEISVTDEKGENLLHKTIHPKKLNVHGKHLLLARPGGKDFTNNYGELLALKHALQIALKDAVSNIFGDSKLVINYWSKGFMKEKDLPQETVGLIEAVKDLRETFELMGGKVKYISGDDNPADLGFH